jgi:hypothetical protein
MTLDTMDRESLEDLIRRAQETLEQRMRDDDSYTQFVVDGDLHRVKKGTCFLESLHDGEWGADDYAPEFEVAVINCYRMESNVRSFARLLYAACDAGVLPYE